MGDLQCAARDVVVPGPADAEALRPERPAAVLAGPGAGESADSLARELDVLCRDLNSGSGLVPELDALADEYRGECVAVVLAPTAYTDLLREHGRATGTGGVVVEVDADGQRWTPWPVSAATGR